MKSLDSDKKTAKATDAQTESTGEAADGQVSDNNGFFTTNDKIDFDNVKVEPLFEEEVDFDTFSKSDFRAVKVKECVAVPKSKKLLQFTLDDGTGTDRTILTLINMVRQFADLGNSSGIDVVCDAPCRVLEGSMWKILLQNMVGNIIFIDEENHFIRTKEFAEAVKESDNYFVIITRENLYNLPYSVEEIYGIHSSGKYQNTKRVYQEIYKIYPASNTFVDKPEKIIVEDTNSGYEFFKSVANEHGITCESAGGKTKLFSKLLDCDGKRICIVADGAAIGPEVDALYKTALKNSNIKLYLPESFEWIILSSGLLEDKEVKAILDAPENYIESQIYFSWERYFTKLLPQL